MSIQTATDFVQRANEDESIRKVARQRFADIVNVGREHGYDFTHDEFRQAMQERKAFGIQASGDSVCQCGPTRPEGDSVCQCGPSTPEGDSVCQCGPSTPQGDTVCQCGPEQCTSGDTTDASVCQCGAETDTTVCQCGN